MIYVACPYSSPDLSTRNWRYQRAKAALFSLWDQQIPAVCPVVLGHEYEQRQRCGMKNLPHGFWMMISRQTLIGCTQLYLLTLPGWRESAGVREEVMLAHKLDRPVIGFPYFEQCEDASGFEILAEFGLSPHKRYGTIRLQRPMEEKEDD